MFDTRESSREYESIIFKIAMFMQRVERESELISKDVNRTKLKGFVEVMFNDLTTYGETTVFLGILSLSLSFIIWLVCF